MVTIAKKRKKAKYLSSEPSNNIISEFSIKKLVQVFKIEVIKASANPKFIHHEWFLKYHLEIVEKIALEACKYYPQANKNMVLLLVWLHDYGKILDFNNQYKAISTVGKKKLLELGFPGKIVEKAISYITVFDKKTAIIDAPIEIQIVSSADGAAHLIGPFFAIHWKEQSQNSCADLMKENKRKALIDWNKKIVLSEVKKAFLSRHKLLLEHTGKFPKKYLP